MPTWKLKDFHQYTITESHTIAKESVTKLDDDTTHNVIFEHSYFKSFDDSDLLKIVKRKRVEKQNFYLMKTMKRQNVY